MGNIYPSASVPTLPDPIIIGGNGGHPFECTGGIGDALEQIRVFPGKSQIKAITIYLSGGQVKTYGEHIKDAPYQQQDFERDEFIESLSLWDNGKHPEHLRLGAIKLTTTKGRKFMCKMDEQLPSQEHKIPVHSGHCVGIKGRCGDDIDALGVMFI